jgi:uncharacterized protein YecE (DUF72 family)
MPPGEILVGTSGYSFKDWVGPFYPRGMKPTEYLGFYAERFPAVEVNTTYYGIPKPSVLQQMERRTPPGYHFVVKLNQAMTHERKREDALYGEFLAAIQPLKDAGKYDGLLAQVPWGFRRDQGALQLLKVLREQLPGEPLFVEFRHTSWMTPVLEAELKALDLGYCSVDEPQLPGLLPPVALRTGPDAYVRFHGRNGATWWGGAGDRYDYDYKEDELREWLKKVTEMADQARRTYLFFNNCHAGQAARNATLMQELVRQQRAAMG